MRNKSFIATLIVGTLFGASVLLTVRGHDLDLLYLELALCKEQAQQLTEDNNHLTQQLTHAKRDRRLHKIEVIVETAPDEFIKLSVKKKVKEQLRSLIDKKLTLLEENPKLFRQLLELRSFQIADQSISLKLTSVVIGETTTIYLDAVKEAEALQRLNESGIEP